jgi:hypothetical protein
MTGAFNALFSHWFLGGKLPSVARAGRSASFFWVFMGRTPQGRFQYLPTEVSALRLKTNAKAFSGLSQSYLHWYPESQIRETRFEALLMHLGFRPGEGTRGLVVGRDERIDVSAEFGDAGEAGTLQRLAGED